MNVLLLLSACIAPDTGDSGESEEAVVRIGRTDLDLRVGPQGVAFEGDAALGVGTSAWGRGAEVESEPVVSLSLGRTTPPPGAPIAEWWRPHAFGVEQGWTIRRPPAGKPGAEVFLAVRLDGVDAIVAEGAGARLTDATGRQWEVSPPTAFDADGRALAARLDVHDGALEVRVDDRGARYPIVVDPVYSTYSVSITRPSASPSANFGDQLAVGDMGGDGIDDLFVFGSYTSGYNSSVFGYRGGGGGLGSSATYSWYPSGATWTSFAVGDFTCDGDLDLLVGYTSAAVYEGNSYLFDSSATYSWTASSSSHRFGSATAAADVDGDGCDEAIVGAYSGKYVRLYDGNTLTDTLTSSRSEYGKALANMGDVNGDGYADVAIATAGAYGSVALGGATPFTSGFTTFDCGQCDEPNVGIAGDIDGDGYDDIISGDSSSSGDDFTVKYGGASASRTTNINGGWTSGLGDKWAGGDYNGDGYSDIAMRNYGYGWEFYDGSASGIATTSSLSIPSLSGGSSKAIAGDFDDDGADDLVVAIPSSNTVLVYRGALDSDGDGVLDVDDCNDEDASISTVGTRYTDADGDGYGDSATGVSSCGGDGTVAEGTDCDDTDPSINPDAAEGVNDGVDTDCDGGELCYQDSDRDGYGTTTTRTSTNMACTDRWESTNTSDCDDLQASAYPGGTEVTGDGIDGDCDGAELCYVDADEDGYRPIAAPTVTGADTTCTGAGEALSSAPATDCDDGAASTYPGADEDIGDGVDADCDGGELCYADADADGARLRTTVASPDLSCTAAGEAGPSASIDCDDGAATVFPGATETVGDEVDQDCTGSETCYVDADGDGQRSADGTTVASADEDCVDAGEAPAAMAATDCDDAVATTRLGAPETADDGVDADCDGGELCYVDADGDGARTTSLVASADLVCTGAGEAGSGAASDCDDGDATAYPGGVETVGDEVDGNCDGGETCYLDVDEDGYRPASGATIGSLDADCADAREAVLAAPTTDCDDTSALIHPGVAEIAGDGADSDCDGVDVCFVDADRDGARVTDTAIGATVDCSAAGEAAEAADLDCDDAAADVYPGASERVGDEVDQDCDGTESCWADGDQDGYRSVGTGTVASADVTCADLGEARDAAAADDCDDADPTIHPAATETVGDGIDANCDGVERCFADADADGWRSDAETDGTLACTGEGEAAADVGLDCDDADAAVNPEAAEVPGDAIDQDCDAVELCYVDADADGHRPDSLATMSSDDVACDAAGEASAAIPVDDCDDASADVYAGAPEVAGDGIDQDCDGVDAEEVVEGDDTGTGGEKPEDPGCGCASPGGPAGGAAVLMAALALVRRRAARGGR